MAEYIEREAAIAAAFSATSLGNSAFRDVFDTVNRLRLIPATDVAPVRHGRWVHTPTWWFYCSECGVEPPNESNTRTPYCPNCGCRMDLEETK